MPSMGGRGGGGDFCLVNRWTWCRRKGFAYNSMQYTVRDFFSYYKNKPGLFIVSVVCVLCEYIVNGNQRDDGRGVCDRALLFIIINISIVHSSNGWADKVTR